MGKLYSRNTLKSSSQGSGGEGGGIPEAPIDGQAYNRKNAGWSVAETLSISDHGALSGLYDDDHPQYLLRDEYEANNESYRNISRQQTMAVNEKVTIGLDNTLMTASPAIFKKGAAIIGNDIDLIREPYTVTPAAYGDEVIDAITSWKIPKDQFDHFDFSTAPLLENTYPSDDHSSWTTKDGWILSETGLTTGSLGDVNDGNEGVSSGAYAGFATTGTQSFTIELPTARYVASVRYIKTVSYNPITCTPGLKLIGVREDMSEVILYDFGTFLGDTLTFSPIKLKKLILFHDSAFGNASASAGMLVSEMGEVMTSETPAQALLFSDGIYYSVGTEGLTSLGAVPDWSQAVDSGYIDNTWLAALISPELVFASPVQLTITYGAIIPQIAIQNNPIDVSEVANITFKAFDDAGTGIRLAMSPNSFAWYVWDGAAFVSIGSLTADSAGADTLYNQGMTKAVYDAIPLAEYEAFLAEGERMFFAYGTNNPRAEIVEHRMTADSAAPFVPHTGGTLQLFSDRITYTANVAGDFLFVVST